MENKIQEYLYKVRVLNYVDADTIDVLLDLGLHISVSERLRLNRINAWESRGKTRDKGKAATEALKKFIADRPIIVETIRDTKGKYGRYLAEIWVDNGGVMINVNDWLVEQGHGIYQKY